MKSKNRLILLLIINISASLQLLTGQTTTINLNKAVNGNQLYEATQKITLLAGFTYDSQNKNSFIARVIPANGKAYGFTESTDNSSVSLNTSNPVGAIDGNWSVSPTGGGIYSMPIKLPPGIGGMVPNLSVTYNSQSGEGLLGKGWNISGISGITRVGSDLYHEGKLDHIWFNSNDHYALDGQRLIPVSPTEYRTENETFCKITAYGPAGDPTYFVVETKDGKIIEYGNTTDSRIEAHGRSEALVWNVNKVSNKSGNYITVTYSENNSTGEYYPLTINYTGTTNNTPFNTIQFEYQNRSVPILSYVTGCLVTSSVLIKNINIKTEATTTSQFQFVYDTYNTKLAKVVEYGKNGAQLNATNVNWGIANTGLNETGSTANSELIKRYSGDFNGDGKTDYVVIKNSKWSLNLSNGYGGFIQQSTGTMPDNFKKVYQGDFNGDGKEDLLIFTEAASMYNMAILESTGTNFTQVNGGSNSSFSIKDISDFFVADFDGDGKTDIFVKYVANTGTMLKIIKRTDTSNPYYEFQWGASSNIDWGGLQYYKILDVPLDMNGDGKTDLMVLDINGSRFYECKNGTFIPICTLSYPTISNTNIMFGDLNGDGKTDILTYEYNNNLGVKKIISKGNGFLNPIGFSFFEGYSNPGLSLSALSRVYAADIDGDGKTDLIAVDSKNLYVRYSKGQDFNLMIYTPSTNLSLQQNDVNLYGDYNHFGDYYGDGTTAYYYDNGTTGRMFTFYRGKNQQYIASITNGFGLNSGLNYCPLTDNTVYTKGGSSQYPLMDYQGPLYVVSSAWADNVTGTRDETKYIYNIARIHLAGKGFLGFQQITSTNLLHNVQTIDLYEYSPTYFNVSLKQRNVNTVNGTAISKVVNTNSLIELGSQRLLPYVSKSVENNYLSNNTKTTSNTIDKDGNPSTVSETYDDGSYNTTTYSNYSNEGSWMAANPGIITITKKHYSDNQTFSLSTTNTYQTGTGLVLTSTTGLLTTTYEYNENGMVKKVAQTVGSTNRTTRFEYEPKGRFVTKTYNALNQLTEHTFDSSTGNILTETTPNGKITSYTYDNFGKQTGITYPTGQTVTITYQWAKDTRPSNALFYKQTTSTGLPTIKEYYDGFGRVLRTEKTGFNGKNIYSSRVYNDKGQVTQASLPYYEGQDALAKNYTYDDYGRLQYDAGPSGTVAYTYSGKTTQTVTGAGHISSKTVDSQGNVVSSSDEGGTITYAYKSHGKPGQIKVNDISTSMIYDAYGRQTQLTDPDAGTSTYSYNGYNELIMQTDAKKNVTNITYDLMGRILTRNGSEGTTTYSYDPSNNPGLLNSVVYPGGSENYAYDTYGRITVKSKTLTDGSAITYTQHYSYDSQGRVTGITYPSGFSINNVYNPYGYLAEVRRTDNNALIWKGEEVNALNEFTQYKYGNNLETTKSYNNTGLLTNIQTGQVQNLTYNFDTQTGNLMSRSDGLRNHMETFSYDNLNRLTSVSGPSPLTMTYDNTGNLTSKTGIGDYTYGSLPHAVSRVSNPNNIISTVTQNISYTSFNKVDNISEGSASLQYTYDGDRQRSISKFYQNGVLHKTTHYVDNFEKEIIGNYTRELHYISGGDGLAAIYVHNSGADTMYYVHTDMLGSYDVITNESGAVVQYYSFDAWGRRRNPTDWTYNNMPNHSLFSRGYTGHEHLDAFNLINMNGRVYDPLLGRILSPDNVVQDEGLTQSFNRYSYCLNNPFVYFDPSGYTWFSRFGDYIGPVGKTILSTAVTIGVCVGVTAICVATGGIAAPVIAIIAGASGGFTGGLLGTALNGGSGEDYIKNGASGAVVGGITGIVGYGVGGWTAKAAQKGFLKIALSSGANTTSPILNGAITGLASGSLGGFASGYVAGLITTGDPSKALEAGINGFIIGGAIGLTSGIYGGIHFADEKHLNAWSGEKLSSPNTIETLGLTKTMERINNGEILPFRNDGSTFQNREGLLPEGTYKEYVHPTPGINGPGPQRIVIGDGGEIYYTPYHYKSFIRIK